MSRFGAIILAAGMSSRMGDFKIMLPWTDDRPILLHVIEKYIALSIDPIFVITGREANQVKTTVADLPVQCVFNPIFETGEILSSVKAGLHVLPDDVDAVFINPADMPRIPQSIIQSMLEDHQPKRIVAPRYDGQRGHPILLDRAYFEPMLNLPDDGAPRDVIQANKQHITFIDTADDGVIIDIDTPETYQRELKRT